jgi:threonine/homoserine/homoserine lactone efflux protein
MTLTGFLAYSAALGIAAAIPGPGLTALIARALGSGFRAALAMSFGLMVGDLTYLTAVVLGLAFVAQTFGMVFLVIKWLGVTYLAFLGWRFWTSGITPETVEAKKGKGGLVSSFIAGLAVTLGNPKTRGQAILKTGYCLKCFSGAKLFSACAPLGYFQPTDYLARRTALSYAA